VDDPVKFMARNEEMAVMRSNQAIPSRPLRYPEVSSMRDVANPVIAPFKAKARPGTHGSRRGVRTVPTKVPRARRPKDLIP
jgi:hypothetical protein